MIHIDVSGECASCPSHFHAQPVATYQPVCCHGNPQPPVVGPHSALTDLCTDPVALYSVLTHKQYTFLQA